MLAHKQNLQYWFTYNLAPKKYQVRHAKSDSALLKLWTLFYI